MNNHNKIWDAFCAQENIIQNSVPLFEHKNFLVNVKKIGQTVKRSVLCRSVKMEQFIQKETDKLVDDWIKKEYNLERI